MSYLHVVVMWHAEGGKLGWKRDKRWGEGVGEKVRERINNMCEKGEEKKGDTLGTYSYVNNYINKEK